MDSDQNNTIHLTTSARKERFVPTCPICGNKHWPRDPSCLGKKGAKAKAKAKASAKAKARAKRLGPASAAAQQRPEPAPQVQQSPAIQPSTTPAILNGTRQSPDPTELTRSNMFAKPVKLAEPVQPAQPVVIPPKQNTEIQPEPKQQQGGETVVKINAKLDKEITSFKDEITRIKRQADQVVLRTSEDAAHRVDAERTARKNAEEKARSEAAARLEAEQKLHAEIVKLKALQEEARQAAQSSQRQMEMFQQEFASDSQTIKPVEEKAPIAESFAELADTDSPGITPSYTISNVGTLLSIRARDIMETNIIWAGPDDTISKVLDRMLAGNSHYAIVAAFGKMEGIVSRTELTGPINECLVPFIAKWKRADTDATFNIAVKWIMSKQINGISPDDSCTAIMKTMRAQNMCPLPVIDQGKTIGLVTPFNVFKIRALLKLESDNTAATNRQLIQALPARITSYMSALNDTGGTQQNRQLQET